MKPIRALSLTLLALFFTAVPSHATVIVYKGSGRFVRGDTTVARTVPTTVYFILDPATFEGRWVFQQTVAGVKSIFDDGSRQYGLTDNVKTAGKGSAYYSATGNSFVSFNNFSNFAVRLGGKKVNVVINAGQQPALITKTMTGSYTFVSGLKVVDGAVTISVDLARTQFANSNTLNVTAAANAIINSFVPAKGYINTAPNP